MWADYVLNKYFERSEGSCQPYSDKGFCNQFDNDGKRTNDFEGYNHILVTFVRQHPYIWVFISKIKWEESTGITGEPYCFARVIFLVFIDLY